jgi:hypothetical protein
MIFSETASPQGNSPFLKHGRRMSEMRIVGLFLCSSPTFWQAPLGANLALLEIQAWAYDSRFTV